MIALRDLHDRTYVNKECTEFTYNLEIGERNVIPIRFVKIDTAAWSVFAYVRVNNAFRFSLFDGVIRQYAMSMKLEEVCAQGLVTMLRASTDMGQLFQTMAFEASKVVGDMPGMAQGDLQQNLE